MLKISKLLYWTTNLMTMLSEEGEMAEEEEEWADSGDEDGDITDDGAETDQLLARIRGRWQFVLFSLKR